MFSILSQEMTYKDLSRCLAYVLYEGFELLFMFVYTVRSSAGDQISLWDNVGNDMSWMPAFHSLHILVQNSGSCFAWLTDGILQDSDQTASMTLCANFLCHGLAYKKYNFYSSPSDVVDLFSEGFVNLVSELSINLWLLNYVSKVLMKG